MGNGVGSDWFAENVMLANKISDVRRRGKEKKQADLPRSALRYNGSRT